jgi:acetate kinase
VAVLSASSILVVNAGSTSLKLSVVDADEHSTPVGALEEVPPDVGAVGHRVVHGGDRFREPVVIDDAVERELGELVDLAPLHNRPALVAIREARERCPSVPHIAAFDTAFHATIAPVAATYALPQRWRERGIRRYGFHGLSVQWAAERIRVPRLAVCHLGGGCSVTAVLDGRSVDTTMGFSPLEGVPMATRGGSIDPGALLFLLRAGVGLGELDHGLEHESGLLGLSGTSGDVAELENDSEDEARLALEVYCYRIAQAVAAMATTLGGLDAVVFTGGVGEHSAFVRTGVCRQLAFLGLQLNEAANGAVAGDAPIAAATSSVQVEVVRAREDAVIARAVRAMTGDRLQAH